MPNWKRFGQIAGGAGALGAAGLGGYGYGGARGLDIGREQGFQAGYQRGLQAGMTTAPQAPAPQPSVSVPAHHDPPSMPSNEKNEDDAEEGAPEKEASGENSYADISDEEARSIIHNRRQRIQGSRLPPAMQKGMMGEINQIESAADEGNYGPAAVNKAKGDVAMWGPASTAGGTILGTGAAGAGAGALALADHIPRTLVAPAVLGGAFAGAAGGTMLGQHLQKGRINQAREAHGYTPISRKQVGSSMNSGVPIEVGENAKKEASDKLAMPPVIQSAIHGPAPGVQAPSSPSMTAEEIIALLEMLLAQQQAPPPEGAPPEGAPPEAMPAEEAPPDEMPEEGPPEEGPPEASSDEDAPDDDDALPEEFGGEEDSGEGDDEGSDGESSSEADSDDKDSDDKDSKKEDSKKEDSKGDSKKEDSEEKEDSGEKESDSDDEKEAALFFDRVRGVTKEASQSDDALSLGASIASAYRPSGDAYLFVDPRQTTEEKVASALDRNHITEEEAARLLALDRSLSASLEKNANGMMRGAREFLQDPQKMQNLAALLVGGGLVAGPAMAAGDKVIDPIRENMRYHRMDRLPGAEVNPGLGVSQVREDWNVDEGLSDEEAIEAARRRAFSILHNHAPEVTRTPSVAREMVQKAVQDRSPKSLMQDALNVSTNATRAQQNRQSMRGDRLRNMTGAAKALREQAAATSSPGGGTPMPPNASVS